jgi:predicted RNA-binding Zn-ribbon protein involved in translation (DUF1610 family)
VTISTPSDPVNAWLLLAVGDDRAFGSNDGYDDEPDSHYRWDSTVPNHARITEGDAVVLWDKKSSIGVSVVENIDISKGSKLVYSCPHCGKAHIKARKTKHPRYRCFACNRNFDDPAVETVQVTEYTSSHSGAWIPLEGLLSGSVLRSLCLSPRSQLSLRPLDWAAFNAAVAEAGGPGVLTVVGQAAELAAGGHTRANVRVRRGQPAFRKALFDTYGPVCIFTGKAPAAALEAGHLYSYATVQIHHEHGGFLMRRDLHRLFDMGLVAIHPESLTIDVSETLFTYPLYHGLHGQAVTLPVQKKQLQWLRTHWLEHRS